MKYCKECNGKIVGSGKKFCSHSCSATHNNRGIRRHGHRDQINCLNCQTSLIGKSGKKYCSSECQQDHKYKLFVSEWMDNPQIHNGNKHFLDGAKRPRKYLFERANNECEKCGWSVNHPILGKPPLQINHIDGNWWNNQPNNLEVLCPNCHALTENFGNLNKGKGRKYRYADEVHEVE